MKELWGHMAHCKDPKCKVRFVDAARHCQTLQLCRLCDHAGAPRASTLQKPHCVSSRYVLSHYRKCKKACEVCSPVRQAIERHNRRLAAMQKQASESGANPKKRTAPTGQAYSGGVKRQRTGSSQSRGRVRMRAAAGAGVGAGAGAAAPARPASTAPVDTKASVCCTMTREEVRRVACRRFCRRLLVVRPTSADPFAIVVLVSPLLASSFCTTSGLCGVASTPFTARPRSSSSAPLCSRSSWSWSAAAGSLSRWTR